MALAAPELLLLVRVVCLSKPTVLQWFFQNSCHLELFVKASDHFSLFPCIPKQTPNVQCVICFCKYIVTFHFWQWTPVNPSDCTLSEENLSSNGTLYQWSKGRHHFGILDVTKIHKPIVEIDFEAPFRIKSISIEMIFSSRRFFQKTNKQIRLYYLSIFLVRFWTKVKTQKNISKLTDL